MRCIYCNSDEDLTVSDIIPAALTGAKIRKKFVCRAHNLFTNDHYEKAMIQRLDIFRNRIGLTERDGDPVRFSAGLTIGDYISEKKISISNNKSVMDTDRLFRMKDKQGRAVLVGSKENLLKINGATEDKIIDLPLEDISVSSMVDIQELFISESTLHAVAKIAYEWHCFINNVEELQENKYSSIISYILNPKQTNTFVEVVNDKFVVTLSDYYSRTGSNMLFEYNDLDGNTYVIFFLWNVIGYKVKVCEYDENPCTTHCPIAYFYHADGTQDSTVFGVLGNPHVSAISPCAGLTKLFQEIKIRLLKLDERDLSQEYLQKCITEISNQLQDYQTKKISIAELLDFEHEDRIIPVYILEQIYTHREEYRVSETFYQNMRRILQTNDRVVLTKETVKKILNRYLKMDSDGTFITMLKDAFVYFHSTCCVESKVIQ